MRAEKVEVFSWFYGLAIMGKFCHPFSYFLLKSVSAMLKSSTSTHGVLNESVLGKHSVIYSWRIILIQNSFFSMRNNFSKQSILIVVINLLDSFRLRMLPAWKCCCYWSDGTKKQKSFRWWFSQSQAMGREHCYGWRMCKWLQHMDTLVSCGICHALRTAKGCPHWQTWMQMANCFMSTVCQRETKWAKPE